MKISDVEHSLPGEAESVASLIEMLGAKMKREQTFPDKMKRDAHPKQVALLKAEFRIEPNLPPGFNVGIFATPKSFPAWIRFSNQNAPPAPDNKKDIRGAAIKIMEVEGEKILENEKRATTQDFILISTNVFVTRNIVDFAKLIKALTSGKIVLMLFFLLHPRIAIRLLRSNKNFGSLLEARFWSVAPSALGNTVVKYCLTPQAPTKTSVPPSPADNYLTDVMTKQLTERDYFFDFQIQVRKVPEHMPVEDLSVAWSEEESPFVKVATVKIPAQHFDTAERKEYGDNLSFTPWHSLVVHKPLGNVSRGRRIVYEALSKLRHTTNGIPLHEPSGFTIS